jgi:hypothetical protein
MFEFNYSIICGNKANKLQTAAKSAAHTIFQKHKFSMFAKSPDKVSGSTFSAPKVPKASAKKRCFLST